MPTILSTIGLSVLCVYFALCFGRVFYGNLWDALFSAVIVALLFKYSWPKIINLVRRTRNKYDKTGRILAFTCLYLILTISVAFIPAELRTISTLKYVRPALIEEIDLKPIGRIIVVSYGEKDASVIVISKKSGEKSKYFIQLSKRGKNWAVADSIKVENDHYTFPPY